MKNITKQDWQYLKEKYKDNLSEITKKIDNHYPIQYLIGDVEFINTKIMVDESVLIPRFETEFLVEKTIKKIETLNIENPKILELGTGSGCISIALKKNILSNITAVEISIKAIEKAKENAKLNEVTINFIHENMLNISYENYDVIISNPPYVDKEESVGEEIKYEPEIAIYAPNKGLYFYEEIIKKIKNTKNKPKLIAFEIGMSEGYSIKEFTQKYISNYTCMIEKDLSHKDRYAFLTLNE